MALIALVICTIFVLFLLVIEQRSSRAVSIGVWIPTLWMIVMASRPLGVWFVAGPAGGSGGNESGSELDRWFLTGLLIVSVIMLTRRRFDWRGNIGRHKWLLAVIAYMLASTFWSDLGLIALRRWVRELIVVIMAFLLISDTNPRQALVSVIRRCAYVLIPFSLILVKYYPHLGRAYGRWSGAEMWTGVTGQKNQLGRLCMISIFFLLSAVYRHWSGVERAGGALRAVADFLVVLIALYLLRGCDSSTSMATLGLGVVSYMGLQMLRKLKLRMPQAALLALVTFLLAFGASTPFVGGANVATFSASLGRDSTLTGRTEVWRDVVPAMKQQPLLGYGLGSFWTDARRVLYDIPTAHNGYLDILLELGAVGLAFYVIWLLSSARQLNRGLAEDYHWASIAICFLLMALLYNVSESALNSFTEQMTAVLALTLSVVLSRQKRVSGHATDETTPFETNTWGADTWPELMHDN